MIWDLVIVGAGPTGIACAIEAQKKGLNYIVLEKGVLVNSLYHFPSNMTFFSTSVNLEIGGIPFISHTDKPTRKESLEYYRRIVQTYNLNIQYSTEVLGVSKSSDHFYISTNTITYKSTYLIIATGFYDNPRMLGVPGEELEKVKHYFDDAHIYIGKKIVVVGGANSACDVALETWQKGADVTMVVRNERLYEKVKYWILPNIKNRIEEGSIKAYFNTSISLIKEDEVVIHSPEGEVVLENDYVLAMTGYMPNFEFLKAVGIELDSEDNIPVHNSETLESNVKGIYCAGVVLGGYLTSKLFIENTRHHGSIIIQHILENKI